MEIVIKPVCIEKWSERKIPWLLEGLTIQAAGLSIR